MASAPGGVLAGEDAAAAAGHLASCAECREAQASLGDLATRLARMGAGMAVPPPRADLLAAPTAPRWRRAAWAAAAAGLLLPLSWAGWRLLDPRPPHAGPGGDGVAVARAAVPAAPPGRYAAPADGLVLGLGGDGTVACVPGSRIELLEGEGVRSIRMDSGAIWVDTAARLAIETDAGTVTVSPGEAALSLAEAAFPTLQVVLLDGASIEVDVPDGPATTWVGPALVRVDPERAPGGVSEPLTAEALSSAFAQRDRGWDAGPWRDVVAGGVPSACEEVPQAQRRGDAMLLRGAGRDGTRILARVAPSYECVLEVDLCVPAGAQVGLCVPVGSGTGVVTLGSGATAPGERQTIRLVRVNREVTLYAGGRRLARWDAGGERGGTTAPYPAAGLVVWGGPVEVRGLRWRPLGGRS